MEKPVYLIIKFDLIGKVFYTYRLMTGLKEVINEGKPNIYEYEDGTEYPSNSLFELTTQLSKYKKENLFKAEENEFLPYFADVTEDLPSHVKFEPKTYKNCQLMSQKHGGYLQFFHKPTGRILRIAMNSNIYRPVTK